MSPNCQENPFIEASSVIRQLDVLESCKREYIEVNIAHYRPRHNNNVKHFTPIGQEYASLAFPSSQPYSVYGTATHQFAASPTVSRAESTATMHLLTSTGTLTPATQAGPAATTSPHHLGDFTTHTLTLFRIRETSADLQTFYDQVQIRYHALPPHVLANPSLNPHLKRAVRAELAPPTASSDLEGEIRQRSTIRRRNATRDLQLHRQRPVYVCSWALLTEQSERWGRRTSRRVGRGSTCSGWR